MEKERIAFVGTGVMGASIVKHLLHNGHEVTVYTRTREKAEPLVALGASWASSPAEAFAGKDIALTMVGYPRMLKKCILEKMAYFNQQRLEVLLLT